MRSRLLLEIEFGRQGPGIEFGRKRPEIEVETTPQPHTRTRTLWPMRALRTMLSRTSHACAVHATAWGMLTGNT